MYMTVADEPLQVRMGDSVWRQILCTYKFCAGLTCVKTDLKKKKTLAFGEDFEVKSGNIHLEGIYYYTFFT
jgi:hypothetical protein